ncbi:MAG: hypothetical protein EXS16_15920 [Gemmataceae bacterium]|nr:hypothetical protein [Gemmataceae bacterium]
MTESLLRREIEKAIDTLPVERLSSVADYIAFLNRPTLGQRIEEAERDLKANKGVDWRKVRDDV